MKYVSDQKTIQLTNKTGDTMEVPPAAVAKPLPPLNFNQGLKQWLKIANTKDIPASTNEGLKKIKTMTIDKTPFMKSIIKTTIPKVLELLTSYEFIAPTLPVPEVVISMPLAFFKTIKAVGIDPNK